MGAKKKGGLANKLARMTDDERAKYLQRKADMEEEARRRKEQLVATFMKNKLKKEDAFSRLNLAKINQQWHQIMRTDKCTGMKAEVEHLRKWIDRIVTLKNKTIKKLIEELDWQEELYGKNFSGHSDHIDTIIEFHNKNLQQLCKQYEGDRKLILHIAVSERGDFEKRTGNEIVHLKTIIYGQEVETKKKIKEDREENLKKIDEILSTYRTELSQMKKGREKISCALWRQMAKILKTYTQQTDVRRSHLAELQRLDVEGAVARTTNQQLIDNEERQLEKLKHEYSNLVESREDQIKNLESTIKGTTTHFFKIRKRLSSDINHDDKQLTHLTDVSNQAINHLEKLSAKGDQILQTVEMCKRLETDKEKINRWSPFIKDDIFEDEPDEQSTPDSEDPDMALKSKFIEEGPRYKPKYSWEAFEKELEEVSSSSKSTSSSGSSISTKEIVKQGQLPTKPKLMKQIAVTSSKSILRPKTGVSKPPREKYTLRQLKSEEVFKHSFTQNEDEQVFQISTKLVKTVTMTSKRKTARPTQSAILSKTPDIITEELPKLKRKSTSAPKSIVEPEIIKPQPTRVFDNNFDALNKLEGLWWFYNKVEMDCIKMKKEKKALIQENNKLKGVIKDVLEAAALGQSIPSAKSNTASASRKRFVLSAPLSSYSIF